MCLGVPGQIVEIQPDWGAVADVDGNQVQISVALLPDVKVGDYVLIHAGFAMELIDREIARETRQLLEELKELRQDG
ncbi:MAG TPA: HypC/HybG/HupF family hydrogenase formation chaperone [Syntrophomonadaceae bacterium]|jgi:hydrogenase expression/formation protein HypC|nr:HypC/HybG/HupF family hydrogenase formation chaperone [Syntrophomonadaceae bacterium]HOQ09960.1 HypC/HybG/HupF family hydrogenase formation chaperone [Syntrophomonadaceae bacterium]HPU49426.1 HypC/HybG/HupF family hydrogenase formation chaperone [Syntrophomonadaceae bacterium]